MKFLGCVHSSAQMCVVLLVHQSIYASMHNVDRNVAYSFERLCSVHLISSRHKMSENTQMNCNCRYLVVCILKYYVIVKSTHPIPHLYQYNFDFSHIY